MYAAPSKVAIEFVTKYPVVFFLVTKQQFIPPSLCQSVRLSVCPCPLLSSLQRSLNLASLAPTSLTWGIQGEALGVRVLVALQCLVMNGGEGDL